MEDIKIGEYVKVKTGQIGKVIGISPEFKNDKRIYSYKKYYINTIQGSKTSFCILKHSFNKIDLVEVGDYVNGEKVLHIENGKLYVEFSYEIDDYTSYVDNKNIKNIVTKEQFAQMQYNFEEE